MSFRFGQFGTGFAETLPRREALQFRDMLATRGVDVKVVTLSKTGEDDYGNPVLSESSSEMKAFLDVKGSERSLPSGDVKAGTLRFFTVPWVAISEEGSELEIDGVRYHVSSLVERTAYLQVEAERKVG